MPCPKSAQTSVTSEGKSNVCGHVTGVVLLSGDFSRCPASTSCPYDSASMYCTPTDEEPIVDDQNLKQELNEKGIKLHKICPTAPNHSSGTPSFFADLRVPDDNAACQVACACNEKKGFGPPDCFPKGEPLGLLSCCYCDGQNMAYDKKNLDNCGNYLPIYGEGVLPNQVSITVVLESSAICLE